MSITRVTTCNGFHKLVKCFCFLHCFDENVKCDISLCYGR